MSAVPVVSPTGVTSASVAAPPATPTSCKFSLTLARKVHRIKKMLKPVLEMVHKRCRKSSRKSQQFSQSFEEDESPADQNAANEALEQRLAEELRAGAGSGAAVAVWCDGRVRLRQVMATQGQVGDVAVPASFLTTAQGGLCWVTPDADILLLDGSHESQGLAAEQQTPATATLLSTPSSSQEPLSVHSF